MGLQADAEQLWNKLLWALRSSAVRKSSLLGLLGSQRGQSHLCKQLGFYALCQMVRFPGVQHGQALAEGFPSAPRVESATGKKCGTVWGCSQQTGVKLQFCISKVCPVVLPLTDCSRWKQSSHLYLALLPPTKPSLAWQQKRHQISAAAPPPLPLSQKKWGDADKAPFSMAVPQEDPAELQVLSWAARKGFAQRVSAQAGFSPCPACCLESVWIPPSLPNLRAVLAGLFGRLSASPARLLLAFPFQEGWGEGQGRPDGTSLLFLP